MRQKLGPRLYHRHSCNADRSIGAFLSAQRLWGRVDGKLPSLTPWRALSPPLLATKIQSAQSGTPTLRSALLRHALYPRAPKRTARGAEDLYGAPRYILRAAL